MSLAPGRLALRFTALSDVGRVRRDNQDSGYAGPHLLAVADGVGGAARGDIASSAAIQELRRLDHAPGNDALEQLAGAVHLAHNKLADLVAENAELDGTSTTTTAGLFNGTHLAVAHVGDSRGYLLRNGELQQLTKDHTFVQSLVDEGRITDDEARVHPHRNLILRAVDAVHEPEPDTFMLELEPGDRLLLCSDGCCGVLSDDELARLLAGDSLDRTAPDLVNASLEAGSSDNVTVVVAEVVEASETDDSDPATPMVVGAAAGGGRAVRAGLRRRRHEPEAPVDPEALRYAPLPPRRVWPRVLGVLVVVLVIIAIALFAGYRYTQSQYYVSEQGGRVVIFKGVPSDFSIGPVELHHVYQDSALPLAALPVADQDTVRDGITRDNLGAARSKLRELTQEVCSKARSEHAAQVARLKHEKKVAKAHPHRHVHLSKVTPLPPYCRTGAAS